MGYNSHIFRGIYCGGVLGNLVYTRLLGYSSHIFWSIYLGGGFLKLCICNKTFISLIARVGYNSHIFKRIYWGGGLGNFVNTTRPLFT